MSHADPRSAVRPDYDPPMREIADYVLDYRIDSDEAYATARVMLLDSLACAALAMAHPACVAHLGPLVPGADLHGGARVPYTAYELDPAQAAYNIGTQIRWLDFNDTWLAAEWGHPSDNLGTLLALADYLGRRSEAAGGHGPSVRELLGHAIKAHEIQGGYALRNAFNRVGLDHVQLAGLAALARDVDQHERVIAAHDLVGEVEPARAEVHHGHAGADVDRVDSGDVHARCDGEGGGHNDWHRARR